MLRKADSDDPASRRSRLDAVDYRLTTPPMLRGSCAQLSGIPDHHRRAEPAAISPAEEDCVRRRSAFGSRGVLRWRQVFLGTEAQLSELRRWLRGLLPDCPARCDVITVAVEFAANAIRHSASGEAGGYFATEVTWYGPVVRVAVADGGGPNEPMVLDQPYSDGPDGFDEHGHGLKMVEELSSRTGAVGGTGGRVVWAEVPWPEEPAPSAAVFEHAQQETIATAERTLRRRFTEFLSWYGRETLEWWACPRFGGAASTGLVSARTAADLAELLTRARRGRLGAGRAPGHGALLPPS